MGSECAPEIRVRYALVFSSAAADTLGFDSDLDIAVTARKPLSGAQRFRLIADLAAAAGRPGDLVDLKTARGVVFARALRGRELFCDSIRAKGEAWYRRASLIEDDLDAAKRSFALALPKVFR